MTEKREDGKNVYLGISTLESVYHFGVALKEFFHRSYRELFFPLGLHSFIYCKPFYRGPSWSAMNLKNWLDVGGRLAGGELEELTLTNIRALPGQEEGGAAMAVISLKGQVGSRHCAGGVELSVHRLLIGDKIDIFQEKLLGIAIDTFKSLRAVSGYIAFGSHRAGMFPLNPFGQGLRTDCQNAPWNFRNKICGCFWGNMLSAGHIEKLGGIERIKREAPAYRVAEIKDGGNGIFLQATPRIESAAPGEMDDLQNYLSPLLPAANRLEMPVLSDLRVITK